ncbi:MAG: HD family phosphohydrolase [Bdellovibrionota bacterium]
MRQRLLEVLDFLSDFFRARWSQIIVPLVLACLTGLMVQNPFQKNVPAYEVGEIAKSDIKSLGAILVVDDESTRRRQDAAELNVSDVFDFDSQLQSHLISRIQESFSWLRQNRLKSPSKKEFEDRLKIEISDSLWKRIEADNLSKKDEAYLINMIRFVYQYWILEQEPTDFKMQGSAVIRDLISESQESLLKDDLRRKILFTDQVSNRLRRFQTSTDRQWQDISPSSREILLQLAEKLILPNLAFNQVETKTQREESRAKVEPVLIEIAKGEMILREGQRVERKHVLLLESLKNLQLRQTDIESYLGFVLLLFVLVFLFHWIGVRNFKRFKISGRDRLVLGGFFVLSMALVTGLQYLFDSAEAQSATSISLTLLIPLAFPGMMLRLFTSIEITSFFCLLFNLCVAWLFKDPFFGLLGFVVCMAGAASMRHMNQRIDVLKAGLLAGGIEALCLLIGLAIGLSQSVGLESTWLNVSASAGFAILSGVFSAGLVLAAQPLIEYLGYTTDLRLMELSNTNHPLLREMIMKAPGSYFHSFTVGQLSEKAAEAINANPLFARVASLYHDVGKTKKPQYFIENIKGENKHDRLVPSMSALIISNHVKEGIELAESYKLPQSIIDVIPQHHGTSLISFFYEKAKQAAESPEDIDEKDFRYPGPKPQTKEAAIIMLADAVEATAKSLQGANLDQLRQKVGQTIKRFFLDGQLDECELSLKDLNSIGDAFIQVLQGIYHQRIDYPHLKDKDFEEVSIADQDLRSVSSKSADKS